MSESIFGVKDALHVLNRVWSPCAGPGWVTAKKPQQTKTILTDSKKVVKYLVEKYKLFTKGVQKMTC